MRAIDVTDYKVDDSKDLYPMKEALAEVLFHPALKIMALDLLKRDELARKILRSPASLLVEETEYAMIKAAVEKVDTYTRNDVIFVERVLGARTVEVVEK
jgi:hypothetical protein